MSTTASQPTPALPTADWRVEIPMPVLSAGRKAGQSAGWLSLNRLPTSVAAKIVWDQAKKDWRLASFMALVVANVPRNLDRIEVTVELRFPDRKIRDTGNYEPTLKPIIDALGPQRVYRSANVKKDHGLVVEIGRGIIPSDDPRHLIRPHAFIGEPLGRSNPIKGVVVLHIRNLTPEAS